MRSTQSPTDQLARYALPAAVLFAVVRSADSPKVLRELATLARRRLGPAPLRPFHVAPCDDDECRSCPAWPAAGPRSSRPQVAQSLTVCREAPAGRTETDRLDEGPQARPTG